MRFISIFCIQKKDGVRGEDPAYQVPDVGPGRMGSCFFYSMQLSDHYLLIRQKRQLVTVFINQKTPFGRGGVPNGVIQSTQIKLPVTSPKIRLETDQICRLDLLFCKSVFRTGNSIQPCCKISLQLLLCDLLQLLEF